MSKKQEIGGFSEKGRMVDITGKHVLWVAKNIDGKLVVEKFSPGKKSEHNLYIECCNDSCRKSPVNKVFIPNDVQYFMNEHHSIGEFLSKCNTFAHMALKRQICIEFAQKIVEVEDPIEFDRLSLHSKLAQEAVEFMQNKVGGLKVDSELS